MSSVSPAASSSDWVWNWDWSCGSGSAAPPDLGACSGCNYSITVRVLSPGDDGSLTQSTSTALTSAAGDIASTLQGALATVSPASVAPPIDVPPAPPVPVAPALPGLPSSSGAPLDPPWPVGGTLDDAPVPAAGTGSPETAPPQASDTAASVPASAAILPPARLGPAPAAGAALALPETPASVRAPDKSGVPQGRVAGAAGVALPVIRLEPPQADEPLVLDPLPGKKATDRAGAVAGAFVAAASGTDALPARDRLGAVPGSSERASRSHPSGGHEEPPTLPQLPDQGSNLAAGAAGHGSGSTGGALMGLLVAFIFITPGLTRWLRVGTRRRPRLLRAGRRERPG